MFKVTLLTHEREVNKRSNTGRLLLQNKTLLQQDDVEVEQIIWGRKTPNEALLRAFTNGKCALLYPQGEATNEVMEPRSFEHWVILDGTWQEAHKMWRQSPYLKTAPWYALSSEPSRYTLRRNQRKSGLCTIESAMALLHFGTHSKSINTLNLTFERFITEGGGVSSRKSHD